MAYRTYSVANGFIVDPNGFGDFTTISAAIAAAVAGDTIFIRPGTYTENPTLKAGVFLSAFDCQSVAPAAQVIISGKCTFTGAGEVTMNGITLQTNSDFALAVTGSSASVVNLYNCFVNCINNTGINFTSSSSSSAISIIVSQMGISTSGIAYWSSSSPGAINVNFCVLSNGTSTTASSNSAGSVFLTNSIIAGPMSCSGTGDMILSWTTIQTNQLGGGVIALALSGSGANIVSHSNLISGGATTLTIGGGVAASVFLTSFNSTNATVIGGTGTLNKGLLVFTGSGSGIAGTLTVNTYTTA